MRFVNTNEQSKAFSDNVNVTNSCDRMTTEKWDPGKGQIDITMSNVVVKALVDTGDPVSCIVHCIINYFHV